MQPYAYISIIDNDRTICSPRTRLKSGPIKTVRAMIDHATTRLDSTRLDSPIKTDFRRRLGDSPGWVVGAGEQRRKKSLSDRRGPGHLHFHRGARCSSRFVRSAPRTTGYLHHAPRHISRILFLSLNGVGRLFSAA